jgi:hypothetical protein
MLDTLNTPVELSVGGPQLLCHAELIKATPCILFFQRRYTETEHLNSTLGKGQEGDRGNCKTTCGL